MIINLTQHKATPDQIQAGVVDLPDDLRAGVCDLLTFDTAPIGVMMVQRAEGLLEIIREAQKLPGSATRRVMIGGAPFFMSTLEVILLEADLIPVYAFSRRESEDQPQADGSVRKVQIFRHAGWVCACPPDPIEPGQE